MIAKKSGTVEEILKRIENVFQVEMDLAKQVSEIDTYQTIGFLKKEVLAIVKAQCVGRAELKKLIDFVVEEREKKRKDRVLWFNDFRIYEFDGFISAYSKVLERLVALAEDK